MILKKFNNSILKITFSICMSFSLWYWYWNYTNLESFLSSDAWKICKKASDDCNTFLLDTWEIIWSSNNFCSEKNANWTCEETDTDYSQVIDIQKIEERRSEILTQEQFFENTMQTDCWNNDISCDNSNGKWFDYYKKILDEDTLIHIDLASLRYSEILSKKEIKKRSRIHMKVMSLLED